jgi:hypothetical protein
MSNRKLVKAVKILYRKVSRLFVSLKKLGSNLWGILRTLFIVGRPRRETSTAGFVLPTVVMVTMVVILLTTAILFRSFERAQNASNVRVNEMTLKAATPALDRARAKLDKLFADGRLPRATPNDTALYQTIVNNIPEYTFGDEIPLRLVDRTTTTQNPNPNATESRTAWKFPVDTDNNGKFDSFTLYTINFRTPPVVNGQPTRKRTAIEARTPPMIGGQQGGGCEDTFGTSATLVGDTGWSKIGTELKKSFFVYSANVPITDLNSVDPRIRTNAETYKGNQGFSAIEYQQDRVQLPLINNAVVYEDDLEITPGPVFRLNGRIVTNSNLLIGGRSDPAGVTLYQVSSPFSCFYEPENGKIVVGGNVANGNFTDGRTAANQGRASFHRFLGKGVNPTPGGVEQIANNTSVTEAPSDMAYNSQAYVARINALVNAQFANGPASDPDEVTRAIANVFQNRVPPPPADDLQLIRREQLEIYFKKRTRRVPYTEVPAGSPDSVALAGFALEGSGDTLRPPQAWMFPTDPNDGVTGTNFANVTLNRNGANLIPAATKPEQLDLNGGKEGKAGDRLLIGNNLPQLWLRNGEFVGPDKDDTQNISGAVWDVGGGQRTRRTQVEQLADLGSTDRNRDWEIAAAQVPRTPQEPVGGLRVITGAGIYLPQNATVTTPPPASPPPERVWSDSMPVPSGVVPPPGIVTPPPLGQQLPSVTNGIQADSRYGYVTNILLPNPNTPYLRMRATAVYHYTNQTAGAPPARPIACVSSYYDPTSKETAKNQVGLPPVNINRDPGDTTGNGNSNNGIVYPAPTKTASDYTAVLDYQAQLKYPNGRWVNEPLKNALAGGNYLADLSAIDSAICALQILDGSIGAPTDTVIPHGAIYETAFLDARQVKAIHNDANSASPGVETFTNADGTNGDGTNTGGAVLANVPAAANYDLPREQRQPLEIRATVLDINLLRGKTIGSGEYLIPNSGIIYATRDDALPDQSARLPSGIPLLLLQQASRRQTSTVDYILDPTRRPNAIVLTNGEKIWRTQNFREEERGLILASNLPVYVKGTFNRHTQEEFTNALEDDWSDFYGRDQTQRNKDFACRKGDARLPNCDPGDEWRPASVIADAVTLLSNNFRFGYRSEGDYDLNNNLGNGASITAFRNNGLLNNSGVPNADWFDTAGTNIGFPKDFVPNFATPPETGAKIQTPQDFQGSSYLNNMVSPVQRRVVGAPEYLMEICLKLPASECGPTDWFVQVDSGNLANPTNLDPNNAAAHNNSWELAGGTTVGQSKANLNSGTTAVLPPPQLRHFPRRVAFRRSGGVLDLVGGRPVPLAIDQASGNVQAYPYTGAPPPANNTDPVLWFTTTITPNAPTTNPSNSPVPGNITRALFYEPPFGGGPPLSGTAQPVLRPVLQFQQPYTTPTNPTYGEPVGPSNLPGRTALWLQPGVETTFNLVSAAGDTPARPTEDNGGLHNFVRFLENWNTGAGKTVPDAFPARISGSFIQFKRSSYATAPFWGILGTTTPPNSTTLSATNQYAVAGNDSRVGYYIAPRRQWGYDVGLLSQSPDLFAQKLVRIPDDRPDEFFREVGRDDDWVKSLLCANTWEQTPSAGGLPQPTDQGSALPLNSNLRQGCAGRFE